MGTWKEKKIGPRKWKFKYTYYTKIKPRFRKSKVRASQRALKISKDSYALIMKGKRYKR